MTLSDNERNTLIRKKAAAYYKITDLTVRQQNHEATHAPGLVPGACSTCTELLFKVKQVQNRVASIDNLLLQG